MLRGLYADGVIGSGDFQGNKVYGTCPIFIVIGDSVFSLSQGRRLRSGTNVSVVALVESSCRYAAFEYHPETDLSLVIKSYQGWGVS